MGAFDRSLDLQAAAGIAAGAGAAVLVPIEDWYAAFPAGVRSTVTMADDRVYFVPFYITRACQLDKLGIEVTTLAAATSARVGIYSADANGAPSALVKEAAATLATTAAATVETDIDLDVRPGLYFAAVKVDGAAVVLRGVNGDSSTVAEGDAIGDVDGAAGAGETYYSQSAVATALTAFVANPAREAVAPLVIVKFNNVEV